MTGSGTPSRDVSANASSAICPSRAALPRIVSATTPEVRSMTAQSCLDL
jgi:hypothetical protein